MKYHLGYSNDITNLLHVRVTNCDEEEAEIEPPFVFACMWYKQYA